MKNILFYGILIVLIGLGYKKHLEQRAGDPCKCEPQKSVYEDSTIFIGPGLKPEVWPDAETEWEVVYPYPVIWAVQGPDTMYLSAPITEDKFYQCDCQ